MMLLKHLTTGIDGETYDIGRVMGLMAFIVGIGLQIYVIGWRAQPFDFLTFGGGVAALAGGIGAMIRLKQDTEPTQ